MQQCTENYNKTNIVKLLNKVFLIFFFLSINLTDKKLNFTFAK